ncbi:MAG: sensor histidine kinase [Spirochaetes bacterium]|nr:sensor histidine kinase [Spirochaetota bacterium]
MTAFLLPALLALTLSCSGITQVGTDTTKDDIVLLTSECEYRLGDSPMNRDGTFLWAGDAGEAGWTKCDGMLRIRPGEKERFIWYRFRTPSGTWKSPRFLIIAKAIESAQIYINKKMVSSFGKGTLNREGVHATGSWYMIHAPKDCFKSYLFLRIHSTIMAKGLFGKIYLGSFDDLYHKILLADIYKLGLVLLYLIISVFSLGVFIARRDRYEYLAFSIVIVSIALLTFELCLSAQLLFSVTLHNWKLWATSVLVGTPSMVAFLEFTFHERYRKAFRMLWRGLLLYGLAAYIGDFLGIVPLYYPVIILMILSVPIMLFLYGVVIKASFRGDTTARIFFAGMSVFFIIVMFDYVRFLYQVHLANAPIILGFFVLIISMGIILIQKFSQTYRNLQDMTVNLAEKVEERTAELQEANRRLEKNDEEKTAFFTNLAHEIKTPLTLIVNALRAYIGKYGMSPDLEPMSRNLDLLLRDINNFFDIMKWERGIDVYRHDRLIDLSDFTGKKIELFRSTAAGRRVAVDSSIEEEILLSADPSGIDRLLNNLLDNAIKYNAEGGSITVTLGRRGGRHHPLRERHGGGHRSRQP